MAGSKVMASRWPVSAPPDSLTCEDALADQVNGVVRHLRPSIKYASGWPSRSLKLRRKVVAVAKEHQVAHQAVVAEGFGQPVVPAIARFEHAAQVNPVLLGVWAIRLSAIKPPTCRAVAARRFGSNSVICCVAPIG